MILDEKTTIDDDQQSLIARWATKTVMVSEFLDSSHQQYFTREDRADVMNGLSILPNTSTWLGRYVGRRGARASE